VFHHQRDSIEAHLRIVFAALAISRHLQGAASMSIKKLIHTLRPGQIRDHQRRLRCVPDVVVTRRRNASASPSAAEAGGVVG
jgi:hypothetical protein